MALKKYTHMHAIMSTILLKTALWLLLNLPFLSNSKVTVLKISHDQSCVQPQSHWNLLSL